MKVALLMLCHRSPKQINEFIYTVRNANINIFIHVDKKFDISKDIIKDETVFVLDDNKRHSVEWAKYSQIEATLELIKYAMSTDKYDYFLLISGQDFPLTSSTRLISYLESNKADGFLNLFPSLNYQLGKPNNHDKNNDLYYPDWIMGRYGVSRIIRRVWVEITGGYNHTFRCFKRKTLNDMKFYFGSQWWGFSGQYMEWMMNYLGEHTEYCEFFMSCSTPDESFFHTLYMNSPFSENRTDYLHYIDWSEGKSSPKTLTCDDLDKMFSSGKLMARKIDSEYDENIILEIKKRIGV